MHRKTLNIADNASVVSIAEVDTSDDLSPMFPSLGEVGPSTMVYFFDTSTISSSKNIERKAIYCLISGDVLCRTKKKQAIAIEAAVPEQEPWKEATPPANLPLKAAEAPMELLRSGNIYNDIVIGELPIGP